MTREEQIDWLCRLRAYLNNGIIITPWNKEFTEALNKALEQEPCGDAISRQAAIDAFGLSEKTRKYGGDHSGYDTMMLYEIQDILENLPPVTPQSKIGHWIDIGDSVECSECGHREKSERFIFDDINFCAKCGVKMVEPQYLKYADAIR